MGQTPTRFARASTHFIATFLTPTVVYGDQTTTRGSKPKKGWIVTVFNVPMLTTAWYVLAGGSQCLTPMTQLNNNPAASNAWFNATCQLQYVVNEAAPVAPTNNFVAAPPASITYGLNAAIVPASNDASNANSGLAATWTVDPGSIASVLESLGASGGDGTYTLHWSAVDNVGISEKNIQLIEPPSSTNSTHPRATIRTRKTIQTSHGRATTRICSQRRLMLTPLFPQSVAFCGSRAPRRARSTRASRSTSPTRATTHSPTVLLRASRCAPRQRFHR